MNFPARARLAPLFKVFAVLITLTTCAGQTHSQEIILSINAPPQPVGAGSTASLWLNALNPSRQQTSWTFPESLEARISSGATNCTGTLALQTHSEARTALITPGSFARREYLLTLPATATGQVMIGFPALNAGGIVFDVASPPRTNPAQPKKKTKLVRFLQDAEPIEADQPFDPGRFFKQQISPHEPMYFIAGPESPNAKFQISFKYQLLNEDGWLATNAPALKGFHVAYTQTSLWDLGAPSAPFFDTSYKPAFLYAWERVAGGQATNWFRLDLMGGAQHESNGKGGGDSRSLNLLFLRPTLVFGRDDRLQLTLQPRVWGYIGDLNDNPDLTDYRGYFDLRAVVGWRRGLQLSALGRMGHEGNNHSLQLDLTYPTMRFFDSFSVYLHAQYFTGYGDSLLRYNQRTDAFRVGFSLYR